MKTRLINQYIRGSRKAERKMKRITNSKRNRTYAGLTRQIDRMRFKTGGK